MKILFITSRIPYPPYRGDKLKIYNLIKNLSKTNEIILLSFIEKKQEFNYKSELLKYCSKVEFVYLPVWKSILNSIFALFSKTPFQVAYYKSSGIKNNLAKLIDTENPDLIHTHLLRMAPYTQNINHAKKVIDLTDAVSLYLERFYKQTKNPFYKLFLYFEKNRIYLYESIIKKYNCAFVCSDVDKNYLYKRNPDAKIKLLLNGVDLDLFKQSESIKRESSIIFTGNMSYFPNIDAAEYFVKDIFPIVLKAIPNAHFYIVGQNPSNRIKNLSTSNITVTGFVKNIAEEYLKSEVAVSPVRYGAGTLNKILEPLSLGIPIVSTSIGSVGLKLENGKEIFITDSKAEFAQSIIRLLQSKSEREIVGNKGKEKVRAIYGWEKIATDLQNIYNQI